VITTVYLAIFIFLSSLNRRETSLAAIAERGRLAETECCGDGTMDVRTEDWDVTAVVQYRPLYDDRTELNCNGGMLFSTTCCQIAAIAPL